MKRLAQRWMKWTLIVVVSAGLGVFGAYRTDALNAAALRVGGPDKEDRVDTFRTDVYVVGLFGQLVNPIGFCSVEPCDAGLTPPSAPLFTLTGSPIDMTWGEYQTASARSTVDCKADGTTTVRVRLSNLRPNTVYSLFYRQFGPDSINPRCFNNERSLVVPEKCHGAGCIPVEDSNILTDADGKATYVGEVNGCLLDAQTLVLDAIIHLDGRTHGPLPNRGEFETQTPATCTSANEPGCNTCVSSFGFDAFRHALIIQKEP